MDPEKADILEDLGNIPEELYDELVAEYAEMMKEKVAELESLLSSGNYDEFIRLAHFVKGASLNLRLSGPQSMARAMESAAREHKDPEVVNSLLLQFKASLLQYQ